MKMADSLSFTIDVEFVDILNNRSKQSDQYKEREAENNNEILQEAFGISAKLDNPATLNPYRVVWNGRETTDDVITSANPAQNRAQNKELTEGSQLLVDPNEDANASRYASFLESIGKWMDEQWALWTNIVGYTSGLNYYTEVLYGKSCKNS